MVLLDEKSSEAMEGDAKYMAPELMRGNFGKPADVFRWVALTLYVYLLYMYVYQIQCAYVRSVLIA